MEKSKSEKAREAKGGRQDIIGEVKEREDRRDQSKMQVIYLFRCFKFPKVVRAFIVPWAAVTSLF